MNDFRLRTEVLVVGAGIAGCVCALRLAEAGREVTLLTAGSDLLESGNTRLAQGGIVYRCDDDDPKCLERDILDAGRRENYVRAVRFLCRRGPEILAQTLIAKYKIPFAQRDPEHWNFVREGGHSMARIIYSADHTGLTIMKGLAEAIQQSPNVRVLTRRTAIDLLTAHHHSARLDVRYSLSNECLGAYVFNDDLKEVETVFADFTVLATGGVGQVFLHTTNARGSIGSGLAMAVRAGARTVNNEFVQFHPTALFEGIRKADRRFLISEAVRGVGARLVNSKGEPFMARYDQRADLAPRDVVTRAIMEEMLKTGDECVYLDASKIIAEDPVERFPTISRKCKDIGVDIRRDPIPVVPAAHYFCGGVLSDLRGRTSIERLYAVGECSCTGVHGANRLASTSLLEGMLWGACAADDVSQRFGGGSRLRRRITDSVPDWISPGDIHNEDPALIAQDWNAIRTTMWNYVGIARSTARLSRALGDLGNLQKNLQEFYRKTPISKPLIDLFHGCQTAQAIASSALRNKRAVGCHYRVD